MSAINTTEHVTVAQAAKEIGTDPLTVRYMMRIDRWDLGVAIPPNEEKGMQHWRYYIFRPKLDRFLGKIS